MQRVLFFLVVFLCLTSCSIPGITKEVHTFEGDYARIVDRMIPSKGLGYFDKIGNLTAFMTPSGSDNSWIRVAFGLPEALSGDMTLIANAKREGIQKLSADMSLTGNIAGPTGTIEMKNISGKFFMSPQKGRYYGLLDHLDISGTAITEEIQGAIDKAQESIGKWWVYDPMDILFKYAKTSGASMDDGISIIQVYMGLLQDIQTPGGFARLNSIISQNPSFEATASGYLQGDEYVYPVVFSPERALSLAQKLHKQYAGTEITQTQKEKLISAFSGISGGGELRVNTGKTPYFSFSGSLIGGSNLGRFDVYSFWHDGEMKSVYTYTGGVTRIFDLTYKDDGIIHYELAQMKDTKTTTIESADVIWKKDQKKIDLQFGEEKDKQRFTYNQTKEDDFTIKIESATNTEGKISTPLECQGNTGKIKKISCNITLEEKDKISLQGQMDEEGDISGNVSTPSGNLDFEGHIRKDDFLISASVAGMTATLGNKKAPDGTYVGKLQLPVATVKWSGKISNEILSDFHIGVTSPVVLAALDLTQQDDHVQGPFSIKVQGQEISSGTIMIRSIPKYFDFRLDTIFPETNTPSFIELHKFTDIVWDPSIHLEDPVGAQSILSGSEFEKLIQSQDGGKYGASGSIKPTEFSRLNR